MYFIGTRRGRDARDYKFIDWAGLFAGVYYLLIGGQLVLSYLFPERYGQVQPNVLMLVLGAAMVLASLWWLCSMYGFTADRGTGTLTVWRRILAVPFFEIPVARYDLENLQAVRVNHERQQHGFRQYHFWGIGLRFESGGEVPLRQETQPASAVAVAKDLAGFLSVQLEDCSMDTTIVRGAEDLAKTLRERLEAQAEKLEVPNKPAATQVRLRETEDGCAFDLPPGGIRRDHVVAVVMGAVVSLYLIWTFKPFSQAVNVAIPSDATLFLILELACILFPVAVPIACAVAAQRQWMQVEADPKSLCVRTHWGLFWTKQRIPAGELLDLEILEQSEDNPAKGVLFPCDAMLMARSARKTLLFGFGLSHDALAWIRAHLIKALLR